MERPPNLCDHVYLHVFAALMFAVHLPHKWTHSYTPICSSRMDDWPPCCNNNILECYSTLLATASAGTLRTTQAISLWYPIVGLSSSLDYIRRTHRHKAGWKLSLTYTHILNYHKISFVCVGRLMSFCKRALGTYVFLQSLIPGVCVGVCACLFVLAGRDDLVISRVLQGYH